MFASRARWTTGRAAVEEEGGGTAQVTGRRRGLGGASKLVGGEALTDHAASASPPNSSYDIDAPLSFVIRIPPRTSHSLCNRLSPVRDPACACVRGARGHAVPHR